MYRYTAFDRHAKLARQSLEQLQSARNNLALFQSQTKPLDPANNQFRAFHQAFDAVTRLFHQVSGIRLTESKHALVTGRLQRLAAGESQLLVSGQHAETRYSLWRHLRSIAVSLLGSGLIVTFGDRSDAFHTLLTNIALDEAQIWSEPWQPATDLRDYRTQFAAPVGASWEVQATGTGLALVLRF